MISRRKFLQTAAALSLLATKVVNASQSANPQQGKIFDSHCHIISPGYPIIPNQGYVPPFYPLEQYLSDAQPLGVRAGAVVSGSFHGFDQTYLIAALEQLGPDWVGVTQVPADIPDEELLRLAQKGVRALRFNLFRGRVDSVDDIVALAQRAHRIGGMHAEIYANAANLAPHVPALSKLPQIVLDHMGMMAEGLPAVLDLVDSGARIKATGFGRVKMDVPATLERIAERSDQALMFGTDLPSTRAARPFEPADIQLVHDVLGESLARKAFWDNAVALYKPKGLMPG